MGTIDLLNVWACGGAAALAIQGAIAKNCTQTYVFHGNYIGQLLVIAVGLVKAAALEPSHAPSGPIAPILRAAAKLECINTPS